MAYCCWDLHELQRLVTSTAVIGRQAVLDVSNDMLIARGSHILIAFFWQPCCGICSGVNVIRRSGARKQDKPVDVGVEPQTEADRVLYFELRRVYHGNDGSPQFSQIADMMSARCAAQVQYQHEPAVIMC